VAEQGLHVRVQQHAPIALDVTLECGPRETLALVGPSGSGKSTILRAIAGLGHAALGRISCAGVVWFDASKGVALTPRERRVGFVFQHYGLFPHLSAAANVAESLVTLPPTDRQRRARELLSRVHLDGLEERLPAQLSGGQQQRVALARALAREPNVLLLDEPFAAVDRLTRERLYAELAELRRDLSIPVILVTHDIDEAVTLADRMTVLHHGATLQTGDPFEVISQPRTAEVAQLVGLKNVFRAGVVQHEPDRDETIIEWRKHRLRARLQTRFSVGGQVTWAVSQGQILLLGKGALAVEGAVNPLHGVVLQLVRLGNNAAMTVAVSGTDRPPLFMSVPLHSVQQHAIDVGSEVTISVLAQGIHLMRADDAGASPGGKRLRMQPASELVS
jgi:molybdate transport system ATP-binding protein